MAAEAAMICQKIPHNDLAIQWDCSTEVQDAYGTLQGLSADGAIERNVAQFRMLSARIPEAVQLGYHFCFGTLGGWPRFAPGRSGRDRRACQRHGRGLRPPRRLDPHSGAAGCRRGVLRAAEEPQAQGRAGLSRRGPSHGRLQGAHRPRAQVPARLRRRRLLRLRPRAARGAAGRAQGASTGDRGGRELSTAVSAESGGDIAARHGPLSATPRARPCGHCR